MREIKADSRRNAILSSLRGSEATEAIHKAPKTDSREAYFASAKFMDRHAAKSARDDRESNNSSPTTQATGFCDDFGGFQGAGAGILLGVNEQARAVESSKSAQKPTREGA